MIKQPVIYARWWFYSLYTLYTQLYAQSPYKFIYTPGKTTRGPFFSLLQIRVCHNHLKQPKKIREPLHHQGTCYLSSLGLIFPCNKVLMVDPANRTTFFCTKKNPNASTSRLPRRSGPSTDEAKSTCATPRLGNPEKMCRICHLQKTHPFAKY